MMVRKTRIPILNAIDGLNIMYYFSITGFEEKIDEEKNEEDVKLNEMIKENIEERNIRIEEEKGMSKKKEEIKSQHEGRMRRKRRSLLRRGGNRR